MQCLKCGKSTTENQVFCDGCLQGMDAYPVKPGTPVHLPYPKVGEASKKQPHRKRPLSQDEQILYLRKHLRRARMFAALLAIVLCFATVMLVYEITSPDGQVIGQNYNIDTTQQTD